MKLELGSHQVNVANWFLGAEPQRVAASGGVSRFDDGREVQDHVYATWEYPDGRTATFSSIESNAFEGTYEAFFGTKGTLIMKGEREAYLFEAGKDAPDLSAAAGDAAPDAAQSRAAEAIGWSEANRQEDDGRRITSTQLEISTFCAAIRNGQALACGPSKAIRSARACLRANESAQKKTPLVV